MQHPDGRTLGGVSLKALKFDSEVERLTRRDSDKEIEQKIKDSKLEATRLDVESSKARDEKHKYTIGKLRSKVGIQVTLCKSVIETIKTLTKDKEKRKSFEVFARSKKFEFYKALCQKIQKNFPIDNNLLTKLAYVDPAKIDLEEICNHMPSFIKDETDEVISQLRTLRLNKTDFDQERYHKYLKDAVDYTIPFKDIVGIDEIWSPII